MSERLELHNLLLSINNNKNVYFQPPESVKMEFPCIVYALRSIDSLHANNNVYNTRDTYMVTTIDKNPDSLLPRLIQEIPTARHLDSFTKDNNNHNVFTLVY